MYAKIVLEVPDSQAEIIRKYAEYQNGTAITIRQYLENQLVHLIEAFGPQCSAIVTESGLGDPPQT